MKRYAIALVLVACRTSPSAAPVTASTSTPTSTNDVAPRTTPAAVIPDEAPQPVAVRINADYVGAKAGRWAARFEDDTREVFEHKAEIVGALGLRPGMRIADVGAGTGLFSVAFAEAVGDDGKVFAIDVQPSFLEHIRERAAKAGLDQLVAHEGGAKQTGLGAASVDLAFLCDAYHHLEYPRTYLRDLMTVIVPGGRLAIIDYDRARPGASAWMKDHIRADPDALVAEITAAGFVEIGRPLALEENFFVVFERPRQ
jgi:predicted methyltransferase